MESDEKCLKDLPSELISLISEYLESVKIDILNLALSSKQFFKASLAIAWRKVSVDADEEWESWRKTFSKPKKLFFDYRIFIKSLTLTSSSPLGAGSGGRLQNLRIFLASCPNLLMLVVDCAALNDDDLWILCKSCPNLTNLYLSSSLTAHGKITDEGLKIISKSCAHLQHLVLKSTSPTLFTSRGLDHLQCLKSKLLTFGLEMENKGPLSPPFGATMSSPASIGSPLTDGQGFLDEEKFIIAYCSLLKHHDSLESIILDWPINMADVFLSMIDSVPKLKKLKVGNTSQIEELSQVFKAHPSIKYLSLNEVHNADSGADDDISTILSPLLLSSGENATLKHMEFMGVCQFQSLAPLIPSFKELTSIIFHPSTRVASVFPALGVSTNLIATNCPNLTTVSIPIRSNEDLISFALNCLYLEDLDLQDGLGVDSNGLIILATKCKLRRLCLGSCSFNDVTADIFAKHLGSTLTVLNLPASSDISVAAFIMLASGCKRIERLGNLSPYIPLESLIENLPQMTRLREIEFGVLMGRSPFSRSDLDQIKRSGNRLRLISFQ